MSITGLTISSLFIRFISDFLLEMHLLTFSSRVHDKESAIRFLQIHGIIHNQRLCRNGHEMHLSTPLKR